MNNITKVCRIRFIFTFACKSSTSAEGTDGFFPAAAPAVAFTALPVDVVADLAGAAVALATLPATAGLPVAAEVILAEGAGGIPVRTVGLAGPPFEPVPLLAPGRAGRSVLAVEFDVTEGERACEVVVLAFAAALDGVTPLRAVTAVLDPVVPSFAAVLAVVGPPEVASLVLPTGLAELDAAAAR